MPNMLDKPLYKNYKNLLYNCAALVTVLCLAAPGVFNCVVLPIYVGKPVLEKPPRLKPGSRIAIFTFLMREIGVSRSQGLPWIAQANQEDYKRGREGIEKILRGNLGLELVDTKAIRSHPLVTGGFFPVHKDFHLNPDLLPIVSSAKEAEFMLRTVGTLKADYYALILLDYEVGKIMLRPASATARIHVELYSPLMGLVYSQAVEGPTVQALPYDRSLSLKELSVSYRKQMKAAMAQSMALAMANFAQKLSYDLKFAQKNVHP